MTELAPVVRDIYEVRFHARHMEIRCAGGAFPQSATYAEGPLRLIGEEEPMTQRDMEWWLRQLNTCFPSLREVTLSCSIASAEWNAVWRGLGGFRRLEHLRIRFDCEDPLDNPFELPMLSSFGSLKSIRCTFMQHHWRFRDFLPPSAMQAFDRRFPSLSIDVFAARRKEIQDLIVKAANATARVFVVNPVRPLESLMMEDWKVEFGE